MSKSVELKRSSGLAFVDRIQWRLKNETIFLTACPELLGQWAGTKGRASTRSYWLRGSLQKTKGFCFFFRDSTGLNVLAKNCLTLAAQVFDCGLELPIEWAGRIRFAGLLQRKRAGDREIRCDTLSLQSRSIDIDVSHGQVQYVMIAKQKSSARDDGTGCPFAKNFPQR